MWKYVGGDDHAPETWPGWRNSPFTGRSTRRWEYTSSLTKLCKSRKADYPYLLFTSPAAFCKVSNLKCKGVNFFWRSWGGIKDHSEVIKASPREGCACVLSAAVFPEPPWQAVALCSTHQPVSPLINLSPSRFLLTHSKSRASVCCNFLSFWKKSWALSFRPRARTFWPLLY